MKTSYSRRRASAAGAAVATLAAGFGLLAATAQTAQAWDINPASCQTAPHHHRHGVEPTKAQTLCDRIARQAAASGSETLSYGGGVDGIGVQSGHSKVYLVFYGTQWGTRSTDANGISTFTGDPNGAAPVVQKMFKDIGTGGETWSADLTQWCDGPNVAAGATSCPSNANFVPYQSGGVLSGVWYDNSAASPSAATGHQLGVEAVNAAAHFGNTSAAPNRDAYYVILSPHGTNPDNYKSPTDGYCAWHDYNGDTSLTGGAVASNYGDIAFSNQPYNIDVGQSCGTNFINSGSAGTLDGYTMTLGHEWHEMMSDQNPAGGWTNHDSSSSYYQQENSDECAWLSPGTTGGAANVTMGSDTFAEQASWSNDTNSCAISHAILTHSGTGTGSALTNGGFESGSFSSWTTAGTAAIVTSGVHSGSDAARLGGTGPTNGDSTAAQTFTAANGGTLSFWYDVVCPDTVTYDWATVTLKDNTAGTTATVLAKTCVANSGWKQLTKALTAGHSYTLTLASHDDDYSGDPTYTLYDDVTVG